jgi:multiple sugar transport system substrate-binding protein
MGEREMKQSLSINGITPNRRVFLLGGAASIALGAGAFRAQAQEGQLAVWTPGGSPAFCEIHTKIVEDYIAKAGAGGAGSLQCGIGAANEFAQALLAAIAAGTPPDVAMIWDTPVALGSQGAFLELDPFMAKSEILALDNWPAGLLASCQFKGKTFGLPIAAGVYGMWYNEELFESKGIKSDRDSFPKTWAELRKLSKEFTKWDGDRLETAGFLPPREAESIPIWSALNGSQFYDADNLRYTIDSEQNIEMFEFFVSWLDEEYKGDINAVDRSGAFRTPYASADGLPPAFQEGRQAGLEGGSWVQGDLYATEPVFTRWNVAQHPLGPSGTKVVSGTWPNWFVIPKGSRDVDGSVGYLEYLSVTGVEEWYRRIPDLPANRKVSDVVPDIVVEKRGEEFAKEITAFFAKQSEIIAPMWNSPVQSFGQDRITNAMEKVYLKASPVKDALAEAQKIAQAELDKTLAK